MRWRLKKRVRRLIWHWWLRNLGNWCFRFRTMLMKVLCRSYWRLLRMLKTLFLMRKLEQCFHVYFKVWLKCIMKKICKYSSIFISHKSKNSSRIKFKSEFHQKKKPNLYQRHSISKWRKKTNTNKKEKCSKIKTFRSTSKSLRQCISFLVLLFHILKKMKAN